MDTQKKQHRVAVVCCDSGQTKEFTVKNTVKDIAKMVRKIRRTSSGFGINWSRVPDTIATVLLSAGNSRSGVRGSPSGRLILPIMRCLVCTGVIASYVTGKIVWRIHDK